MIFEKLKSLFSNGHDRILNGKCILLIEDGQVERHTVTRILEKKGCRVLAAENGRIGLHLAETERPDLILLDCMMPGMLGTEVCQRLKDGQITKSIPIIFLTGSDTPTNIINCYDVGAAQFLTKPVSAQTLITYVRNTLQELAV